MATNENPDLEKIKGNPADWYQHIAIVRSDVKRDYFPTKEAYIAEYECISRSQVVKKEIEKLGIKTSILTANNNLIENLEKIKPDLCINFTDSIRGNMPLCSVIPGIFDYLNIPYRSEERRVGKECRSRWSPYH